MFNKKIKLPLLATIFTFFCVNAGANEGSYQFSPKGVITDTTSDNGMDSRIYGVGAVLYIKPVQITNYPYAEAGFINRESSITGVLAYAQLTMLSEEIDGTMYSVNGTYNSPNTPFIVGLTYGKANADGKVSGKRFEMDINTLGVDLGYYLDESSAVAVSYTRDQTEFDYADILDEDYTNTISLLFKKIWTVNNGRFTNLEAGLRHEKEKEGDTTQAGKIAVDYYFDKSLGLGAALGLAKSDDASDEGKSWAVGISKFITPAIGIELEFEQFMADDNESDRQTVNIMLDVRI